MGVFDTFHARCPKCGKMFEAQTKKFDCILADIHPGDSIQGIDEEVISMSFKSRWDCDCGYTPTIVIRDKIFIGFE